MFETHEEIAEYDFRENLARMKRLIEDAETALDNEAEGRFNYCMNRINLISSEAAYVANRM